MRQLIAIATHHREVLLDITAQVNQAMHESGVDNGIVSVCAQDANTLRDLINCCGHRCVQRDHHVQGVEERFADIQVLVVGLQVQAMAVGKQL